MPVPSEQPSWQQARRFYSRSRPASSLFRWMPLLYSWKADRAAAFLLGTVFAINEYVIMTFYDNPGMVRVVPPRVEPARSSILVPNDFVPRANYRLKAREGEIQEHGSWRKLNSSRLWILD